MPINLIHQSKHAGNVADYNKITEGFHFQQEKMKRLQELLPTGISGYPIPEITEVTGVHRLLCIIICRTRTTLLLRKWT